MLIQKEIQTTKKAINTKQIEIENLRQKLEELAQTSETYNRDLPDILFPIDPKNIKSILSFLKAKGYAFDPRTHVIVKPDAPIRDCEQETTFFNKVLYESRHRNYSKTTPSIVYSENGILRLCDFQSAVCHLNLPNLKFVFDETNILTDDTLTAFLPAIRTSLF